MSVDFRAQGTRGESLGRSMGACCLRATLQVEGLFSATFGPARGQGPPTAPSACAEQLRRRPRVR